MAGVGILSYRKAGALVLLLCWATSAPLVNASCSCGSHFIEGSPVSKPTRANFRDLETEGASGRVRGPPRILTSVPWQMPTVWTRSSAIRCRVKAATRAASHAARELSIIPSPRL